MAGGTHRRGTGRRPPRPAAGPLDPVRADLARIGADEVPAPPVPEAVTARVVAALRAADGPRHAAAPPPRPRALLFGAGVVAVVAAALLGVHGLRTDTDRPGASRTAEPARHLTVTARPDGIPLSDPQLRTLLGRPPRLGPLADPARLGGCLTALGRPPDTRVLGATPLPAAGGAVLLVLPDGADAATAVLVDPRCGPEAARPLGERRMALP